MTNESQIAKLTIEFETSGRHSGYDRPRKIGVFLCLVNSLIDLVCLTSFICRESVNILNKRYTTMSVVSTPGTLLSKVIFLKQRT